MAWFWSSTKTLVAEKEILKIKIKNLKNQKMEDQANVDAYSPRKGLVGYHPKFEREAKIKLKTTKKKLEILSRNLEYVKNMIDKRRKKEPAYVD